jgi:nucleoside-diphosphate-sugar epimerase
MAFRTGGDFQQGREPAGFCAVKRVLVSGATGFIGRQSLQPLLERGFEVLAVAHQTSLPLTSRVFWQAADLLAPGGARRLMKEFKPSHLLHFAWYVKPQDYRNSSENLRWCAASTDLVRSFAENGGERAVLCGTCFEYDARFGYCSENLTPVSPSTLYGICKNSLREMAEGFARQAGISLAWGRTFFLYGPFEATARLVPSVAMKLLRREPALCSHGEQLRDFMHVQDVASAFAALLESEVTGSVNIASGVPVKLKDIIHRLADEIGARELVRLGALVSPPDEPPLLLADIRRLRDEVGWRPVITLEEGIRQTVDWWRNAA